MNANQTQLALAVAAALVPKKAKQTRETQSRAMKNAWELRKEAAVRLGCRVHEVLMAVCMKMAYRLETFLGEKKMEAISVERFSRAASSKEVLAAIRNAMAKNHSRTPLPCKVWRKKGVRIYLSVEGGRRPIDMGYLTIEDGKVTFVGNEFPYVAREEIIAATEAAIIASIAEDDAVEVSRTVKDTGTNMFITTYDANGRIIRSYWAD